jgi:signal transduction histidine kinase
LYELKKDEKSSFLSFKLNDFTLNGQECKMVIITDQTSQIAHEKLKLNHKMIKMHTSCVSHDMRAPLSAMSHMVDAVLSI